MSDRSRSHELTDRQSTSHYILGFDLKVSNEIIDSFYFENFVSKFEKNVENSLNSHLFTVSTKIFIIVDLSITSHYFDFSLKQVLETLRQ